MRVIVRRVVRRFDSFNSPELRLESDVNSHGSQLWSIIACSLSWASIDKGQKNEV